MSLPACPQHPRSVVSKDGFYGSPKRQRYRCRPRGQDGFHRFTEPLPRVRTVEGHCEHCERPLAAHEGPPGPRWHEYPVRQIARALVDVGRGVTYRQAGLDAREELGRVRHNARPDSREGSLVAGWVEVFAPVVHAALDDHAEWPDVLLLDAQPIILKTGGQGGGRAFVVLGAAGYRASRADSELWSLRASPTGRTGDWDAFLRRRPGRPKWVVCDFDSPMGIAMRWVWGDVHTTYWLCEWHLSENLKEKLAQAKVPGLDYLWRMQPAAFSDTQTWDAYRAALRRHPDRRLAKWLDRSFTPTGRTREDQISWQITNRQAAQDAGLPRSTGPLEAELTLLRDNLFRGRQHSFRNQERTNRLLQLVQLQRNGHALTRRYTRIISDHLKTNGGATTQKRRTINDHDGYTLRP